MDYRRDSTAVHIVRSRRGLVGVVVVRNLHRGVVHEVLEPGLDHPLQGLGVELVVAASVRVSSAPRQRAADEDEC